MIIAKSTHEIRHGAEALVVQVADRIRISLLFTSMLLFSLHQAETRTAVVETVEIILRRLPEAHRRRFSIFASLFSRSAKVSK